ncbi:conserved hypothetical protein [Methylocella tundrae]|uniref:Nucleotidyl transferase AbiEii toxin, Type IV TA system n=1 Tax=Methylocella tundrae TaxID=227605 RepID=A0A4U8Z7V2_METTU|nr:hypothetical protein [Methylocella tundrae]WPP02663.1 hypothetical protein SIN04_00665 [Methylocella tundrae]VFU17734.1 conserved protein of unknown function [Methylocella tundrae]VTZ27254.1 conserved hypothetical protein [Methylocella tundrae]VTZ48848.1 conserved hypothetical protein [Methylocella tundrae]
MKGLDIFRRHFEGLSHHYVLIGGAACEIIMEEVGLDFRATKDLDLVILVEALDAAFGERFWAFVEAGGYQQRERSGGGREFYRFQKPADPDFPAMLELFSRAPDAITPAEGSALTPLPIDEDIASLSAILLDDSYYTALVENSRAVHGVAVLDERILIPFKAKAHLDLAARRDQGEHIDQKTVRKHRADVFRLLQLLAEDERVVLPEAIAVDMASFAAKVDADGDFQPKDIGLAGDAAAQTARLRAIYGIIAA